MIKFLYYIRKTVFTLFIATILISIGAAFTSVYAISKLESLSVSVMQNPDDTSEAVLDTGDCYLIKEHMGKIAVYDPTGEIMYTVEVYVKTLPAKDREMLKSGIFANSYGEVIEILGDYTA